MSLYETYRPDSLDSVVGNGDIKQDLLPFIEGKRPLPNALLFTGGSGMGKTTLARIVAKGCGIRDLHELDIADFRGIDTIRDIRVQSRMMPMSGHKKGWILDEFHRATADAQSALLKTLESPPQGVHFFLCTTEPQSLLRTILTRCTQFEVSPLTKNELILLLRRVCKGEDAHIPPPLLEHIAKQAQGSPRAALSMLERAIAREDDALTEIASLQESSTQINHLCQALLKKAKWSEVAKLLKGVKQDPESVRYAVLSYMNAVLLSGKDAAQAAVVIDSFKESFAQSKSAGLTLACYLSVI